MKEYTGKTPRTRKIWLSLPLVLILLALCRLLPLKSNPTAVGTTTPQQLLTAVGTATPQPMPTAVNTATPQPMPTAVNTATPQPTTTAVNTATPQPTTTAVNTATPQPTTTAVNTATPQPTTTAVNTATPQPTATAVNVAATAAAIVATAVANERPLTLAAVNQRPLNLAAFALAVGAFIFSVLALLFCAGFVGQSLKVTAVGAPILPPPTAIQLPHPTPPEPKIKITSAKNRNDNTPVTDLFNQLQDKNNRLNVLREAYKKNGIDVPLSPRQLKAQEVALTKMLIAEGVSLTLLCLVIFNGKNPTILKIVKGAKGKTQD